MWSNFLRLMWNIVMNHVHLHQSCYIMLLSLNTEEMHAIRLRMSQGKRAAGKFENIAMRNREAVEL